MARYVASSIHGFRNGRLRRWEPDGPPDPEVAHIDGQFRNMVSEPTFPCVLGQSTVSRKNYRLALYDELGAPASVARNRRDLYRYIAEVPTGRSPKDFTTFVAVFRRPSYWSERSFERGLWRHLQCLHDEDVVPWAEGVSSDPDDPLFCYSCGGRGFFIIGMSGAAQSPARRFGWTTIIFNAHEQFDALREFGKFDTLRSAIRQRDSLLQRGENPLLADHGLISEAVQYSGRRDHPANWIAPFKPKCPYRARPPQEAA